MNKVLGFLLMMGVAHSITQSAMASELVDTALTNQSNNTSSIDAQITTADLQDAKSNELDTSNIELVEHALYSSVVLKNIDAIRELLPIYRQNSTDDKVSQLLIKASEATLATNQNDYKKSIRLYREILADYPTLMDIRFTLAQLLYNDQQNEAAKDQFVRLRADERVSESDKQVIDAYLTALNKKSEWQFGGSLGYAYDPNVNDIPKQTQIRMNGGVWTFPKKESARGVQYRLSAQKSINLKDNFYLSPQALIWGKSYYTNHDYDEIAAKISLEGGLKDTRRELNITPYFQRRFVAKESYNQEHGMVVDGSYWLTPEHQLSLSGKLGKETYTKRLRDLSSGTVYEVNVSHLWLAKSNQYFSAGIGYGQKDAQDPSRAYHKSTLHGSWTQEWQGGLSSSLSLAVSKSRYQGKDIVGIKRKDAIYDVNVGLWHKNIHFWGITPRLILSYSDTHSNHPFHEIAKSNAYIQFGKKF